MTILENTISPPVRDPNCVGETLANGPINMNVMGNFVTLTFTNVRPEVGQMFQGKVDAKALTAVVVSRVTLPVEAIGQLKSMFEQVSIQAVPSKVSH